MEEQVHLAAQYLAATGICFIPSKRDDSHTNLGFDVDTKSLETRLLSKKVDILAFNYLQFSLEWHSFSGKQVFSLDGKTHREVLQWLQEISHTALGKSYGYNLHYELPYTINDDYTFQLKDRIELERLSDLRTQAQNTLEQIIEDYHLNTEIRTWPHHFDTGAYVGLNDNGSDAPSTKQTYVGFGLAIPDHLSKEHYFYISGYTEKKMIDTGTFEELKRGTWINGDFKGAILPVKNTTVSEAIEFFRETINQFQN
jgi:hypothetical protein